MSYLEVSNENPVVLDGYLDGSGELQFDHDSDALVDYDQEIHCLHDTATSITVRLMDFNGTGNWTITAEHDDGGSTETWSRSSTYAEYTFTSAPSSPFVVDVTATKGAVTKSQTLVIKPQPKPPV